MRSIGIDASTKATGLVVLESTGEKVPKLLLEKIVSFPKLGGIELYRAIVVEVLEAIEALSPDRIVLEGYSLNLKNASSVIPLVELGGLLRFSLHIDGRTWLDPRAGELKKFVMGKGNASKDQMMMFVRDRWGHMSMSNDTADAYGLACMGLAHANKLPGVTKEQRAVIGAVKSRYN